MVWYIIKHSMERFNSPFKPGGNFSPYHRQQQYGGYQPQYTPRPRSSPGHQNRNQRPFRSGKKQYHNSSDQPIQAYFKPSMLEDPWAKLEENYRRQQEQMSASNAPENET